MAYNRHLCCVGPDDRVWRPAIQLNRPASVGFRYHDSSSSPSRPRPETVTARSSAIGRLTRRAESDPPFLLLGRRRGHQQPDRVEDDPKLRVVLLLQGVELAG